MTLFKVRLGDIMLAKKYREEYLRALSMYYKEKGGEERTRDVLKHDRFLGSII